MHEDDTKALGLARQAYESRGLYARDGDGREIFFHPHAFADESTLGGWEAIAPRETDPSQRGVHANRLEELRAMARTAGLPDEKLRDESEDEKPGFKDRLISFTASDETVDRYGDIILVDGTLNGQTFKTFDGKKAKGWRLNEYGRNPVFMAFHEYSPTFSGSPFAGIPCGVSIDTYTDEVRGRKRLRQVVLFSDGTSNPMAPFILGAYKERLMRGCSVGFMPEAVYVPSDEEERKTLGLGRYGLLFPQSCLWENSAVSIPANPNALQESLDLARVGEVCDLADRCKDVAPEFAYVLKSAVPSKRRAFDITKLDKLEERVHPKDDPPAPPATVQEAPPAPVFVPTEESIRASITAALSEAASAAIRRATGRLD